MDLLKIVILGCLIQGAFEKVQRDRIFDQAKGAALRRGKPLLNVGCGTFDAFPRAVLESDVNLDIEVRDVPRFIHADVQDLSRFADNHFGAVFCAHTIEHVEDPERALAELHRVADEVYVITPLPIWGWTWLARHHRWVFLGDRKVKVG